ncbi:MAG: fatty acid cis/trans isomerase, partial [Pseudomonadota bacterium]
MSDLSDPVQTRSPARLKVNFLVAVAALFLLVLAVSACSSSAPSLTAQQATVDYNLLYSLPKQPIPYAARVRPVLERRCVVCHGCYDAPCQLKLSSPAGIQRGASKEVVYDGARIKAAEPTRLFIDAVTTAQWRDKKFFPVLNEGRIDAVDSRSNAVLNLEDSVLYRMLRLKELHPQARTGMLTDDFDVTLNRKQTCPSLAEFDDYAAAHPRGGMPYAMPNLARAEYTALVYWLAQGAPLPPDKPPSDKVAPQIARWEAFLNGQTNKQQLVSRYIYEHLFQAHLHFRGSGKREFYRMVRSRTAPGEPVEVLATVRPYGDPDGAVYYRIVRHQGSIVAKDHLVYELSDQRLQRYRQLFVDPSYEVAVLPS